MAHFKKRFPSIILDYANYWWKSCSLEGSYEVKEFLITAPK